MFHQLERDVRAAASTAYNYVTTAEKTIESPDGRTWGDVWLDVKLQIILFGWRVGHEDVPDDSIYDTTYYRSNNESKLWITGNHDGTVRIRVITTAKKLRDVQDALDRVEDAERNGYTLGSTVFGPGELVDNDEGEEYIGYIQWLWNVIRSPF